MRVSSGAMKHTYDSAVCRDYPVSSQLEWILTNGIGGFAMGTVAGSNTRRYHGLLVAAVRPPTERVVLLAAVEAFATVEGRSYGLSTNQYVGAVHPQGHLLIEEFSVGSHAEWAYDLDGHRIRKRVRIHPGENACTLEYQNMSAVPVQLTLRPLVCHKFYHDNFRVTDFYPQFLVFPEGRTVLTHEGDKLCLEHPDADRTPTTGWYYRFEHPREAERGLDPIDDLYCPCELRYTLGAGQTARLVASTSEESVPIGFEDEKPAIDASPIDLLKTAARHFLVRTPERATVIAGYPWFTDWGRDTMVCLPGLCLPTRETDFAKDVLRSYARHLNKGLIPNRFADRDSQPEYNTADATLWFVQALYAVLEYEWDEEFAQEALGWCFDVFEWHVKGTWYGIGLDKSDGLLRQGAPGVQLTWMDAKVGEWVVTPRHGKPIEVNGLWINALRVMERLAGRLGADAAEFRALAQKGEASFAAKFWKESLGHYLDTVEPDDGSLRPNQLIAMALPFGPASGPNALQALELVRQKLLTPNGVRTLGPGEPGFRGRYEGVMAERDSAYHQGTCWPWLVGPYASAVLRLKGDVEEVRSVLSPVRHWLATYGIGGIAEVYDGEAPQTPGGCPWQAWSVAECLRVLDEIERRS